MTIVSLNVHGGIYQQQWEGGKNRRMVTKEREGETDWGQAADSMKEPVEAKGADMHPGEHGQAYVCRLARRRFVTLVGRTEVMYHRQTNTQPNHRKGPDLTATDGLGSSLVRKTSAEGIGTWPV